MTTTSKITIALFGWSGLYLFVGMVNLIHPFTQVEYLQMSYVFGLVALYVVTIAKRRVVNDQTSD